LLTLTNAYLQFGFEPETGAWRLQPAGAVGSRLEAARLGAEYTVGEARQGRRVEWGGDLHAVTLEPFVQPDTAHGRLHGHTLRARTSVDGAQTLSVTLTFALPAERPYLLWRITALNAGPQPIQLKGIDLIRAGPRTATPRSRVVLGLEGAGRARRLAFFSTAIKAGALRVHCRRNAASRPPFLARWATLKF
jgi:hypothetical protein